MGTSSTDDGIAKEDVPVLVDVVYPFQPASEDTRDHATYRLGKGSDPSDPEAFQRHVTQELRDIAESRIQRLQQQASDSIDAIQSHLDASLRELDRRMKQDSEDDIPLMQDAVTIDMLNTSSMGLSAKEATTNKVNGAQDDGGMAKTYDPHSIEKDRYQTWEDHGYFAPKEAQDDYCIMLPPPNVTGSLHMGHAFQDTLMDILIRYRRMRGDSTLWQCGTDHAGIATQMVVERQLASEGQNRAELGREKFIQAVWDWKAESGGTITQQLRRLGTSMDWQRERFTLDPGLSEAVTEVFCRLYDEDLIYRGKRLVNWDPVLHTAISDLEVISEEENGHLWHIRYPVVGAYGYVVVATTRPETMLGDAAVAVHPNDERYRGLPGMQVKLPLTDRTIPIIADEYVDPDFGSGCVKITPAHDFNDYEVGLRHDLPVINIFTPDAAINENGPEAYVGLDRYEARKRIVEDLTEQDLLDNIEDHKLTVPRGDRSQSVVEPYLTDQWYVKIKPLAQPAIEAVEDGRVRFVPENWTKTYFEWMRNIEDWCISRQLWWGHQIPAWYDDDGKVYVGRSEEEVRDKYSLSPQHKLERDPDVLDTWFSSALWPFSTLGWPEQTEDLTRYYPTNVLVTGFDIIFFWVARMIMMGLKFMGDVPFHEVYIHALVRDSDGQKMSKSKGNILDPLDLIDGIDLSTLVTKRTSNLMRPEDAPKIEKATHKHFPEGISGYGTDALRFTFASLATQGRDIRIDLGRIEGYRNFCNKIWNAARYVIMTVNAHSSVNNDTELQLPERWIISRLQRAEQDIAEFIQNYRFDLAAHALYEFIWDEYCDWYLEFSKVNLHDKNVSEAAKHGTCQTLIEVLETTLRLAHPFMPYITEEIWQRLRPLAKIDDPSIMLQAYPQPDNARTDADAVKQIEWLKTFILGIRRIRAEMDIAPSRSLRLLVRGGSEEENQCLRDNVRYVVGMAKLESIGIVRKGKPPESATALAGDMTLLIPLEDLIDPKAEIARLSKELTKLREDYARSENKLANKNFVDRAPEEVVEKERQRLNERADAIQRLEQQLIKIEGMLK